MSEYSSAGVGARAPAAPVWVRGTGCAGVGVSTGCAGVGDGHWLRQCGVGIGCAGVGDGTGAVGAGVMPTSRGSNSKHF